MADDLRPIRRREDLPPLERAVSDALDELGVRCYGRVSSWMYPVQFLEFLAEEGHTVVSTAELETTRRELVEANATLTELAPAKDRGDEDRLRAERNVLKARAELLEGKLSEVIQQNRGLQITLNEETSTRIAAARRAADAEHELETARAKLAAIDALHPHTELDWWHPCKKHSVTDEESTLNACPACVVETVMGCPRCDDACEYRKILHPDSPEEP